MALSDYLKRLRSDLVNEQEKLIKQALRNFGMDVPDVIDPETCNSSSLVNRVRREDDDECTKWYVDDQLALILFKPFFEKEHKQETETFSYKMIVKYKIFEMKSIEFI